MPNIGPIPTNAADLVAWTISLILTMSEEDQQKIHDGVLADKQAADTETARSESLDAPQGAPTE